MIVFFLYFADDDWHSEDWHRVCWMDLVRRYICQSTMPAQRQATDGRIPPVSRWRVTPNTAETARLLANFAWNWRAWLQAVESMEQQWV